MSCRFPALFSRYVQLMSNKYLFCRYKNTINVLIMRFDYFHALLVINIMLNLWFGTSVNHFYFRNRNVTILKYLDIQNHHFNLKLNINPYHLNSGENYLLSTCQQFIKSDPLFRLPSIFSHEKDYPFVFHTRMRNFQQKKMFSQHSAKSCYFVQFGCVFVGWLVF